MTNDAIANRLRTYAAELAARGDNLYRIRAIRQAAFAVLSLEEPLEAVAAEAGPKGIAARAGIGESLAATLAEYTKTGEWRPKAKKGFTPRSRRMPGALSAAG